MRNTHDYLLHYGDESFEDRPFGAVDSFCLCHGFYMPPLYAAYKAISPAPVKFGEMALKSFDLWGSKYRKVGVVLSGQVVIRLVQMARSPRFKDMEVVDFQEVFQPDPAIQFSAMTLKLSDGTVVIVFRGTDDSIIGWKEDLDILVKKGMPSHRLALDFLEKAAANTDGPIVLCGHSKGGNLALYAALTCKEATRGRIRTVYNLEGPGFHNADLYYTKAYRDLLPRYEHLLPTSAFVGTLLVHDDDYKTVKSGTFFGPLQHDLSFWLTDGPEPDYGKGLSLQGKIYKAFNRKFTALIPEGYYDTIEKVANGLVKGAGQLYLTGLVQNLGSSARGMLRAWRSFDADTRADFRFALKDGPAAMANAVKEVALPKRKEEVPAETPAEAPATATATA